MGTASGDAAHVVASGFTPRAARLRPLPDSRAPLRRSLTLAWTILLMAVGTGLSQLLLLTVTSSPLRIERAEPRPPGLRPTTAALALLPTPRSEALHDRGHITEAHRIAQNQILSRPVPAPLKAWRLSYPFAFRAEVGTAADEFGVDPLLVWSVMRQESRFDPMALSSADAQGLMQIIPSTRDDIASRLAISVGPLDMFDPASNIRFGTSYLRTMLDIFDGDPLLAVAAYNGGAGNVRTWLKDPFVSDQADFLRWIGLSETREFVARVMANYAVYRWLETV